MPPNPHLKLAQQWLIDKIAELLIWLVLVVFFSLYPLYLVYNNKRASGVLTVSLEEMLMKGELLLVAAALAADSLSRLLSRTFTKRNQAGSFGIPQLVLFLASVSFMLLAASTYASLASRDEQHLFIAADYVFRQSKEFFIATLLTGAGVILSD